MKPHRSRALLGEQMSPGPEDQWRPPEPPRSPRPTGPRSSGRPRWMPFLIVALAIVAVLAWQATTGSSTSRAKIDYSEFMKLAEQGHVASIDYEEIGRASCRERV